jgi:signal transduction histidine kinase
LRAQETERSRLAGELHDDISQQMAFLIMKLESLAATVVGPLEPLAEEALTCAHSIAGTVGDVTQRLDPAALRLLGLPAAIRRLERDMSHGDIAIVFTHDNVPADLPSDVTTCGFRVAQEALQNAVRHSSASRVSIHLRGTDDGLGLSVSDDGAGFDVSVAWKKGLGMISMRERVEGMGGRFEICSTPGSGTWLEVMLPYHAGAAEVVAE